MSFPTTWYSQTSVPRAARPALNSHEHCDVCIIGAGIAGLTAALELSQRGKRVIILDAQHVAWGASGRNGGVVSPGWAQGSGAIRKKLGLEHARTLFQMSAEGVEIVRRNITELALSGCAPSAGTIRVKRYDDRAGVKAHIDTMRRDFGYELNFLDTPQVRERAHTLRYFQGVEDPNALHFHPLNYCLGLALAIEAAGGRIFEQSKMLAWHREGADKIVTTAQGSVRCQDLVFCAGGYGGPELQKLSRAYLPIATYVVLTEHLGDAIKTVLDSGAAFSDDRRASDYYRVVEGDRLLWGGRITTRNEQDEQTLAAMLKADMVAVYPQLANVNIELAWSGLMGYSTNKMPNLGLLEPGVWACTSFGGHGLNTGSIGGRVIAEAVCGESARHERFKPYLLDWNGGPFGRVAANAIYQSLKVMDFVQERLRG
ncbi:gamma-glutamylputrescine oxidase [Pseudomonas sp. ok272]|uniref:NAD(P)/FAD-dependent oxidoreductase n=1 Tax=unclassified Pseudomonas TaxID=196821 RepID=UPI0008D30ABB|nr:MULTISPECIES: FAD-binding oxidoreductase [unclassified Pseudomonas]SEM31060.1 gamma-glutamylputrescine oxidase [Pseudomonas sp. ok272]SFM31104.1 gamma-glutamylputrescine oxidase [Pseudomonas sp. ok602]